MGRKQSEESEVKIKREGEKETNGYRTSEER